MTLTEQLAELSQWVDGPHGHQLRLWLIPEYGGSWTVVIDQPSYPSWSKTRTSITDVLDMTLDELEERDRDEVYPG